MKRLALAFALLIVWAGGASALYLDSRTALTEAADGDLLYIHDVSDTSENAGGTSKKITTADLLGYSTALTGGAAGALDALPVATLSDGDLRMVRTVDAVYWYQFDGDGVAEETSPTRIRPDDFVTEGVWVLVAAVNQNLMNTANPTFNTLNITATNSLNLGGITGAAVGQVTFKNGADTNLFTIQAGATGAALSWTLPTAAPEGANFLLNVDADGTMGYTDPASVALADIDDLPGDTVDDDKVDAALFPATGTWDASGLTLTLPYLVATIGFEGVTADDFETVFSVTDPTADNTITFPDASGLVVLESSSNTLTNKTLDTAGTGNDITVTLQKDFTISDPADADDFLLFRSARAITITDIHCMVDPADSAESISLDVQECDSTGDNCATVDAAITCDNDGAEDDGSLTNGAIDAGDWVRMALGAPTGTVSALTFSVYYTEVL